MATELLQPQTPGLTAEDRCDRCGAKAYLRAEVLPGLELLFCGHHAKQHGDKLRATALTVQDETETLHS